MKKILVVLLVLAVAGGVFAQDKGEWTQSASVKLSTAVDFKAKPVTVGLAGWEGDSGSYDLGYVRDELQVSIGFGITPKTFLSRETDIALKNDVGYQYWADDDNGGIFKYVRDTGSIDLGVKYEGETYAFEAKAPIQLLLFNGNSISKLWGYYEMLGGIFHLEAGYKGRDSNFWESSDAGGGSFTSMNDENFALGNVSFGGLDFGLILKNLFYTVGAGNVDFAISGDNNELPFSTRPQLINDALMESAIGVKFVMAPIEFAVNFGFNDYPVYLGVKYTASPVTVGLGFTGEFKPNPSPVKAGIKLEYAPESFGASLLAQYALNGKGVGPLTSDNKAAIGIEPSFWYKVLPDAFKFAVNAGFYFHSSDVSWKVEPVLTWNFLRTGADDFGGIDTGMGVKYTMIKDDTNALTVGFHWKK